MTKDSQKGLHKIENSLIGLYKGKLQNEMLQTHLDFRYTWRHQDWLFLPVQPCWAQWLTKTLDLHPTGFKFFGNQENFSLKCHSTVMRLLSSCKLKSLCPNQLLWPAKHSNVTGFWAQPGGERSFSPTLTTWIERRGTVVLQKANAGWRNHGRSSNLTLKQLLWGLKAEGPGFSTHYKDIKAVLQCNWPGRTRNHSASSLSWSIRLSRDDSLTPPIHGVCVCVCVCVCVYIKCSYQRQLLIVILHKGGINRSLPIESFN